ncbi:missing-in-metastasis isoform X2 [Musca autumnalis]|uniref:missing-in-metastasis isoform X2 n=1 Tax=Musca autumnalis TaxID=221902 RepID=UPI003CF85776
MDMSMERDSSALGSLFQQIINDMKNTSPLWEDFVAKASKLHACLKAAIQAIASYLDAFQKIADAATNSRGASKEIGTALTRVCLRHKAVETRLKTFTAAIMDCLVQPLQEKLEDWKRSVAMIDKEHAKEYKRCRTELKKRSTDTLRLQKKARKGQSDNLQSLMDSHMQDVTLRRAELEEVEKKSLRSAMIEERMRYCNFVHLLQPVVKEECEVMSELGHLQEAMQSIALVTKEPHVLPPASEELIHDAKASITLYPESPSTSGGGGGSLSQGGCSNSLGSRKSSVCSISSMNSSGSSNSPGHPHYQRSLSQYISPSMRLKPGESSDSGFCSSPALTTQASSIANPSHAVTTWPTHSQDVVDLAPNATDRPHTISSAYEKGHQRPPLTVYTFQNPETIHEGSAGNANNGNGGNNSGQNTPSTQKSPGGALNRPPLPVRCSSLERPLVANNTRGNGPNIMQRQCPSPIPAHVTKELAAHLAQQQHLQQQQSQQQAMAAHNQQQQQQQCSPPTYVNMSELANMAAMKQQQQQQQQQQQSSSSSSPPTSTVHQNQNQQQAAVLQQQHSIDSISSIHSNDSNQSVASTAQHQQQHQQQQQNTQQHNQTPPPLHQHPTTTQRSHSSSSMTPSLHSHPSIDSTSLATPPIGQTPTHSSGSSTPQNHYSPLLNNSLSSTAAGTPSGSSIASGNMSLSGGATGAGSVIGGNGSGNNSFVYNVCSPTPPLSANSSQASDILKITENEGNGVTQQQPQHQGTPPSPPTTTNNNSSISESNTTTAQSQPPPPLNANTINNSSSSNSNSQDNSNSNTAEADNLSTSTCSSGAVVENDERSRASVLQKASMFEKQAAAAKSAPLPSSSSSSAAAGGGARHSPVVVESGGGVGIYGTRTAIATNNHHSAQQSQPIDPQDVDKCFEDSLQELNNLIGELDSFQREIDASKEQQKQQQHHQSASSSPQQHAKNVKNLFDGLDAFNCNETMTIITDDTTTTIICESQQQQIHQQSADKDFCTASNQTNSSGCGTDISDTTSEDCNADTRSLTSQTGGVVLKTNLKSLSGGAYNSDSELSRCYVSETSSIMGGAGDGYENPTFAHFAVSSTSGSQCYDDNRSDTISLQRHGIYGDNLSDSGSNVVVIYDHQPPMTPDIDYAKQNSEIVMLRTKPQQYPLGQYDQQEMRELQQLPTNLTELPLSPTDSPDHHQHVATVQPAKQRLSSFRASSEQLQLLNSPSSTPTTKGMHTNYSNGNSCDNNARKHLSLGDNQVAALVAATAPVVTTTVTTANIGSIAGEAIIRKKLPPKPPSLSVFQGNDNGHNSNSNDNNNINNRRSLKLVAPPSAVKLDFKSDLEAKILKQKEKLKKQQQQQQQQQQQVQHQQSNTTTSSPPPPPSKNLQQPTNCVGNMNNNNNNHHHSINSLSSSKASSVPPPASSSSKISARSSPSLNVVTPPLPPPPTPASQQQQHPDSVSSSSMLCNNTTIPVPSKPSITPRPASLSSGSTRIARRSSVNTAKPPPPIRRSSSVTPSPNTPTTPTNTSTTNLLHQQAHSLNTSTENLPPPPAYLLDGRPTMTPNNQQQPPPPVGMPNSSLKVSDTVKALSAGLRHQPASPQTLRRLQQQQQQQQQQQMVTSPPPVLPSATPSMLQSPMNHYHHDLYSPILTTPASPIILPMHDEPEYDAYYNTYVEVQSYDARSSSNAIDPNTPTTTSTASLLPNNTIPKIYQQQPRQYHHQYTKSSPVLLSPVSSKKSRTPTPPTPPPLNRSLIVTDLDETPPPLPPPNPNHLQQQQQQHYTTTNHHNHHLSQQQQSPLQLRYQQQTQNQHLQQQQQHQNYYDNSGENVYGGSKSPTSFRTSSPGGIYAQPKILNNMSSFRTNSPGPNNGHQASATTQSHVPAQPKTNPNLIAQLNARLNSKQQTTSGSANEAIYGVSQAQTRDRSEDIYMRNYGQQPQMSPHVSQQQQQTYDVKANSKHHHSNSSHNSNVSSVNTVNSSSASTSSSTASSHYHPPINNSSKQNAAAETNTNAANNQTLNQNPYNSSQYYAPKHITAAGHHHPPTANNHHQQQQQTRQQPMSQSPQLPVHQQTSHYQSGGHHQQQPQHQQQQQHYTCPPPLEDPPPPPIHSNNNSATMPKRSSNHHHHQNQQQQIHPPSNLASYAAASSSATLPRNMMQQQQRLHLQQQQQQSHYGTTQGAQQQQYHAPAAISGGHQQDQQRQTQQQQYQAPQNISQRPPMPLPHHSSSQQQTQQYQQPTAPNSSGGGNRQRTISSSSLASNKQQLQQQPPIPSRHSSVQQKIFVATNPFIQTTTIHCQSPSGASSVHSQPASPICNSPTPSSIASIYGTSGRRSSGTSATSGGGGGGSSGGHYDSGNGGGSIYYNHHPHHQPQTTFTTANTNYTSTNIDKTGMTRAKAKAEFLENLNQKLAKQSLSGRAFAVRNLINSKALPDPRICHESLMDQIKRGATLKRNQKINDRSAPKIY